MPGLYYVLPLTSRVIPSAIKWKLDLSEQTRCKAVFPSTSVAFTSASWSSKLCRCNPSPFINYVVWISIGVTCTALWTTFYSCWWGMPPENVLVTVRLMLRTQQHFMHACMYVHTLMISGFLALWRGVASLAFRRFVSMCWDKNTCNNSNKHLEGTIKRHFQEGLHTWIPNSDPTTAEMWKSVSPPTHLYIHQNINAPHAAGHALLAIPLTIIPNVSSITYRMLWWPFAPQFT